MRYELVWILNPWALGNHSTDLQVGSQSYVQQKDQVPLMGIDDQLEATRFVRTTTTSKLEEYPEINYSFLSLPPSLAANNPLLFFCLFLVFISIQEWLIRQRRKELMMIIMCLKKLTRMCHHQGVHSAPEIRRSLLITPRTDCSNDLYPLMIGLYLLMPLPANWQVNILRPVSWLPLP